MKKPSPRFWDRAADRYSRQPVADQATYEKKLEATRKYFKPDMRVLELGCGTGSTAIAHAPYVKHIHAVDFSSNMIEIARRKAAAAGIANVTFEVSSIEQLDAPDQAYDAVLALNVLHLVDDLDAALAKIRKMLKPGGFMADSTVCIGEKMPWFKLIVPLGRAVRLMPLVRVFNVKQFEDQLGRAGFVIDYRYQPDNRMSVFHISRKPGRKRPPRPKSADSTQPEPAATKA